MAAVENPTTPTRRALNKQQTSEAIAHAAYELLNELGYNNVTVALIAERAGVSRRTFFNYFASFDDALVHFVGRILDVAISGLDNLPEDYPLVQATERAMQTLGDKELLAPLAELYAQEARNPNLCANNHLSWALTTQALTDKLLVRFPHSDPFTVSVLSHTIIGAAKAAFMDWVTTTHEPITDHDITNLHARLSAAMELVRDGFPTLSSITTRKDA